MSRASSPVTTTAQISAYAPLSLQDSIGFYNDGPRSQEWFEGLSLALDQMKLPIQNVTTVVKQLLPSHHRNKVDLAKDESTNITEFVDGLKRRLQRKPNIIKRSRAALLNRTRRDDEPVEDYVLLIKTDLKAAFPDLSDASLTLLAQYECWKNLPEEIAARAVIKESQNLSDWCDRVDELYEMPPSAVAVELQRIPVAKVDIKNNFSKTELALQKQSKDIEELKEQIKKLTELSMNNAANSEDNVPMCRCNRRTVRQVVRRSGYNCGRPFYSCAAPRENGCGFFRWDDQQATYGSNNNWRQSRNEDNRSGNSHPQ